MRIDQAHDLRRLVRLASDAAPPETGRPRLVAVAGGKGGVGTTTIAMNLAVALALCRRPAVLVDADPDGPDVAALCRLRERATIADVVAAGQTVADSLVDGPAGVRVLPGAPDYERLAGAWPAAHQRLVGQLRRLAPPTEIVVLDAGDRSGRFAEDLRRTADAVLLVSTPDTAAVIDAYAALKALLVACGGPPVGLVVNMARTTEAAEATHARLVRACRRFLGCSLAMAGRVPLDPAVPAAAKAGVPLAMAAPRSRAAIEIRRIAADVLKNASSRPRE